MPTAHSLVHSPRRRRALPCPHRQPALDHEDDIASHKAHIMPDMRPSIESGVGSLDVHIGRVGARSLVTFPIAQRDAVYQRDPPTASGVRCPVRDPRSGQRPTLGPGQVVSGRGYRNPWLAAWKAGLSACARSSNASVSCASAMTASRPEQCWLVRRNPRSGGQRSSLNSHAPEPRRLSAGW